MICEQSLLVAEWVGMFKGFGIACVAGGIGAAVSLWLRRRSDDADH